MRQPKPFRRDRLYNLAVPRYLKLFYDSEDDSFSVVFTGRYRNYTDAAYWLMSVCNNGFYQMAEALQPFSTVELGKRADFEALSPLARAMVIRKYDYLWSLRDVDRPNRQLDIESAIIKFEHMMGVSASVAAIARAVRCHPYTVRRTIAERDFAAYGIVANWNAAQCRDWRNEVFILDD